jgi:hypothetical protein
MRTLRNKHTRLRGQNSELYCAKAGCSGLYSGNKNIQKWIMGIKNIRKERRYDDHASNCGYNARLNFRKQAIAKTPVI